MLGLGADLGKGGQVAPPRLLVEHEEEGAEVLDGTHLGQSGVGVGLGGGVLDGTMTRSQGGHLDLVEVLEEAKG